MEILNWVGGLVESIGVENVIKAGAIVILGYVFLRFFVKMIPMLLAGAALGGVVYYFGVDQLFNAVVLFLVGIVAFRWLYEIGVIATDVLNIWLHLHYLPTDKFCVWYRTRRRTQLKAERLHLRTSHKQFGEHMPFHTLKTQVALSCATLAGSIMAPMAPELQIDLVQVMFAVGVVVFLMLENVHHNPFAAAWTICGHTIFYGYRGCRI